MGEVELSRVQIDSPVGELTLIASHEHLFGVSFGEAGSRPTKVADLIAQATVCEPSQHRLLAESVSQLEEYFRGARREFDLPLWPLGTEFQKAAWQVLREIPYGETLNYARQAERAGSPKGSRAVGSANGRNPIAIIIPCHRVIGADGSLTGFGGGMDAKRWLLDHEQRVLGPSGQQRLI
jgi:methylated-DNA-[protein]-cysteine S-methyltransferase